MNGHGTGSDIQRSCKTKSTRSSGHTTDFMTFLAVGSRFPDLLLRVSVVAPFLCIGMMFADLLADCRQAKEKEGHAE